MNPLKVLIVGGVGVVFSPLSFSAIEPADENKQLRQLFCESKGGNDITAQGRLRKNEDVGTVIVCRLPPSPTTVVANQAASSRAIIPLTPITATLSPPSGIYKLAPGASTFNTSCSANLSIAKWAGFPDTSNGNATLNCRGYSAGPTESSLGCRIEWVGPAQIAIGVVPYGGQISVNFSCLARLYGVIGTVMDFSYQDVNYTRIRYESTQATGSLTVTQ